MDTEKQYPPVYNNSMPQPMQNNDQPPYPVGPPTYDQQPRQHVVVQPVVVTQQPTATGGTTIIVQNASVGRNPQSMSCPNCRALITTQVKSTPVLKTHLIAGLICLCGCWLGCCAIPYCVDSCQGQEHTCPNCGSFIGMNK